METICSSETSVETQRTLRRHIPEDDTACRLLLNLFINPEDGGDMFFRNAMQSFEFQPTFRRNMSPPFSGSDCYLLHNGFLLGLFSTLKMEATCSSETSVDFQRIARCYVLEDKTLQLQFDRLLFVPVLKNFPVMRSQTLIIVIKKDNH
jgi:hypothetical protein